MKKLLNLFLAACFVALFASAAHSQKVNTDYDHSTNFADIHTYTWGQVQTVDSLWADRIRLAVDQQLQAKGWQTVPSGGEVTILALGQAHNQQQEQTFYSGGGWFWGPGMATTTTYNTRKGVLVISMFNTQSKKLIWRSVSSDNLSDKPDKNIGKLNKAVSKMFQKFPPKP